MRQENPCDPGLALSQPVGVGYSYTDKGDKGVWTTEAAAKDVSAVHSGLLVIR
jgi:carboxypeptidase C (cathepsin A)